MAKKEEELYFHILNVAINIEHLTGEATLKSPYVIINAQCGCWDRIKEHLDSKFVKLTQPIKTKEKEE